MSYPNYPPQQPNANGPNNARNNPTNMGAQEFPCNPCNAYTDTSANSYLTPAQKACCCDLEYEMARSKQLILERLRAEHSAGLSFPSCERNSQMSDPYARFNFKASRPVPVDNQYVDVTIRRVSVPSPKQRARSCPAPVQRVNQRPSLQRLPRAYPRAHGPPVHASPSRSASDIRHLQNRKQARSPPVAKNNESAPGYVVKTVTTRTTTKNVSQPQNANGPFKQGPPGPNGGRTQRPQSQNNPNVAKDDAAYGQAPPQYQCEEIGTEPNPDQSPNTNYHRMDVAMGPSMPGAESMPQDKPSGQNEKVPGSQEQNIAAPPFSPDSDQNCGSDEIMCSSEHFKRSPKPSFADTRAAEDIGKARARHRRSLPPHQEESRSSRDNQPVVGRRSNQIRSPSNCSCPAHAPCGPERGCAAESGKSYPRPGQPLATSSSPTPPTSKCNKQESGGPESDNQPADARNPRPSYEPCRPDRDNQPVVGRSYPRPEQQWSPSCSQAAPEKPRGNEEDYSAIFEKYYSQQEQPQAPLSRPTPEKSCGTEEDYRATVEKYCSNLEQARAPLSRPTPTDIPCIAEEEAKLRRYWPTSAQQREPKGFSTPPEKSRVADEEYRATVGKYCSKQQQARAPLSRPTPQEKSCGAEEESLPIDRYMPRSAQPRAPSSFPTSTEKSRGAEEDCQSSGRQCCRPAQTRAPSSCPTLPEKSCGAEQDYQALINKYCNKSPQKATNEICQAPEENLIFNESGGRPEEESLYYTAPMFDEPIQYGNPENNCSNPTDGTQYETAIGKTFEFSSSSLFQYPPDDNKLLHSWDIASDKEDDDLAAMIKSSCGKTTPPNLDGGSDNLNIIPYGGRHSSLTVDQNCNPQPKASLFRCLAQKLSSTYEFISALVSPEASTEGPPKMEDSASVRECARAKRCGRVQFDSVDKNKLQDPRRSAIRKAEFENLVKDTYCPGLIQETVDGRENFNNFSFNISFCQKPKENTNPEDPPDEDPMTLLEAFSMRIDTERETIDKNLKEDATEAQIEDAINQHFANLNPSDLNRSIKSFLLSERKQELEQVEQTKGTSLDADVQKWSTIFPNNSKEEIIAYTGRTKPLEVEPT